MIYLFKHVFSLRKEHCIEKSWAKLIINDEEIQILDPQIQPEIPNLDSKL